MIRRSSFLATHLKILSDYWHISHNWSISLILSKFFEALKIFVPFQTRRLQTMKMGEDEKFSPSFNEAAVDFVKSKDRQVKDLCRLSKFWQKGIPYFLDIPSRSTVFECIAIRAGLNVYQQMGIRCSSEGERHELFLLNGFKEFLRLVGDLPRVRIGFPKEPTYVEPTSVGPFIYLPYKKSGNLLAKVSGPDMNCIRRYALVTADALRIQNKSLEVMALLPAILAPKYVGKCAEIQTMQDILETSSTVVDKFAETKLQRLPDVWIADGVDRKREVKQYVMMVSAFVALQSYLGEGQSKEKIDEHFLPRGVTSFHARSKMGCEARHSLSAGSI